MIKTTKVISALFLASVASLVTAAPIPIDLSSWESDGGGTWTVQGVNNDSVFQSVNGSPTVFFENGTSAQNTSIAGTITVETGSDDDFIGFVLGYQDGEMLNATSEFMLIDWKKANQSPAVVGLSVSKVINATDANDFWAHTGGVTEVARASSLGSTGWISNQSYDFDIVFTSNLIQVMVDNVLELSITAADAGLASFSNGAAGFYNYSQGNVRYAGITEQQVIPQPASAPAMLGLFGLGMLILVRLNQRK